jgi:hypothetical protein
VLLGRPRAQAEGQAAGRDTGKWTCPMGHWKGGRCGRIAMARVAAGASELAARPNGLRSRKSNSRSEVNGVSPDKPLDAT